MDASLGHVPTYLPLVMRWFMHTYMRVNISDYVQFSKPIHLNNLPVLRPHIALKWDGEK